MRKISQNAELSFDDPNVRRRWLRRLQSKVETGARQRGISFDLSPEFAERLYKRQNGCCAVSGFKFNLQSFPEALVKHPIAPSIDRKLSSGDYTSDNVRLVCVAVNFGMGQWGDEVYMTLARAAVALEAKDRSDPDPAGDAEWYDRQREKIAAATNLQAGLPEPEQLKFGRHIAALRRALKIGPRGLREAAAKARRTRELRRN